MSVLGDVNINYILYSQLQCGLINVSVLQVVAII